MFLRQNFYATSRDKPVIAGRTRGECHQRREPTSSFLRNQSALEDVGVGHRREYGPVGGRDQLKGPGNGMPTHWPVNSDQAIVVRISRTAEFIVTLS